MKKILLVSSQWSPKNKTGLGFSSSLHERILKDVGFEVVSVSSNNLDKNFSLGLKSFNPIFPKKYFSLK